ncbi:unnamed protein product [Strongylus vulgaris]|uniref:Uncharacterized protein n=1 Tax=Strongylus vulgaris TaxID=40348 RepID=A0A3P7IMY2_STRVU|nr:unnamed protein product [Strongylus vulgaris]
MKRPQIVPSAPPPEAYYLPALPPPKQPPPRFPGPTNPLPPPCWQPSPSSIHLLYPSNSPESHELNYEEINDKTPGNPEKTSRFNVKPDKYKKKHNPQLHTQRGCTDVACCFIFLLFTIGWGVVAAIGE